MPEEGKIIGWRGALHQILKENTPRFQELPKRASRTALVRGDF